MVLDYLISVPKTDDPTWDENPAPINFTLIGEYGTNWVYFDHDENDPMLLPELSTSKLIGKWDHSGNLLGALDDDYYIIRPIGNEDGVATGTLEYSHGFGWAQRQLQETPVPQTTALYPPERQPIVLTMERRWDDEPGFEGPGWLATIEFADPSRPPDARAIGIYDQDWNFIYTTGAFVWTDTGEVDEDGNPIFKWQTENPPGRFLPDDEPLYYALLLGSAQEGRMVLEVGQDSLVRNFWEYDQGQTVPGNTWLDSGQVVDGNFGTITGVSGDKNEFPLGAEVRIEGLQGTVNSYWAGGDGIEILPTRQYTIGSTIEIWGTAPAVTDQTFVVTDLGEVVTDGGT